VGYIPFPETNFLFSQFGEENTHKEIFPEVGNRSFGYNVELFLWLFISGATLPPPKGRHRGGSEPKIFLKPPGNAVPWKYPAACNSRK